MTQYNGPEGSWGRGYEQGPGAFQASQQINQGQWQHTGPFSHPYNQGYPQPGYGWHQRPFMPDDVSRSSRLVALLLAFFVGVLGVHRFYVGKGGTGILQLFTLGGLGIWVLIDIIMIACGTFTDVSGRRVLLWDTAY